MSRKKKRLVIVDADMAAGWRLPKASIDQLHAIVAALRTQEPDVAFAVVGDPALKWAVGEADRERIDDDVVSGRAVFAPAGSLGGHVAFMARVVETAKARGFDPVVLTDRIVPGSKLGRMRREGDSWTFDLSGVETTVVAKPAPGGGRRRRSGSKK